MFINVENEETRFETWASDVDHQVKMLKIFEEELRGKMGYILARHTRKGSRVFLPKQFNLLKIKTDFCKSEFNIGVNRKILSAVQSLLCFGRFIGGVCLVSNPAIGGEFDKGKELILDINVEKIEGLKPHKFFCDIKKTTNMSSLTYEEVALSSISKHFTEKNNFLLKHFVWTRLNKKKLSYGVIGWIEKADIFYFGSTCETGGGGFDTDNIEKIYCYPDIGSII